MAVKMYKVLKDQKYTGKHRVYVGECLSHPIGDQFPESELFGNEDNIKMALEGQKGSETKPLKKAKIKMVTGNKKADNK